MKKTTLENYTTDKYFPRIVKAVDVELQSRNFVTPVGVLITIGLLERCDVENWRAGRTQYFEQVVRGNLAKAGRILRILRFHAHDLNLKPSTTVYKRKSAGGKFRYDFPKLAKKYRGGLLRHFVRLGKLNAR